jgi:hypothetical protein
MPRAATISALATSIIFILVIACATGSTTDEAADPNIDTQAESNTGAPDATNAEQNDYSAAIPPNALVRLVDPLDDPDHYCIDVAGFGTGIRLQSPLQAHTCKTNDNLDEQFTFKSATGQLHTEEYDLCMKPDTLTEGAAIYLKDCAETPLQKFTPLPNGKILLAQSESETNPLCISVAPGEGQQINAIHKRRDLLVTNCNTTDPTLLTWTFTRENASTPGS